MIRLFGIIVLLIFNGCDAPRTKRSLKSSSKLSTSNLLEDEARRTDVGTDVGNDTSGSSDNSGDIGTALPAEASHCTWSKEGDNNYMSYDPSIGQYNLCQSSGADKKKIFIQLKEPATSELLCLIPTTQINSLQTYIGEPRCLYVPDSKKVYTVDLLKNRTGFTNAAISGVMLMKDKPYYFGYPFNQSVYAPDAYIHCMNMIQQGVGQFCETFKNENLEKKIYKYHEL